MKFFNQKIKRYVKVKRIKFKDANFKLNCILNILILINIIVILRSIIWENSHFPNSSEEIQLIVQISIKKS